MKMYVKSAEHVKRIEFKIDLVITYNLAIDSNVAASIELDSMDLSSLDFQILNFPSDRPVDKDSEIYKKFIDLVNKVDELLELRNFTVLGETEDMKSDWESEYRGIVLNVSKDLPGGIHVFGKIMNTLRVSGHKETRSSRRTRNDKIEYRAGSEDARELNSGEPLVPDKFESIVVKCTVSDQSHAVIPNKEFYSYRDVIIYVDQLLDQWSTDE